MDELVYMYLVITVFREGAIDRLIRIYKNTVRKTGVSSKLPFDCFNFVFGLISFLTCVQTVNCKYINIHICSHCSGDVLFKFKKTF